MRLAGKRIVLGVCGGIAVFKAAALCSKLVQAGAHVKVIMTDAATRFVTPLTFQTMSRQDVVTDLFAEEDPAVVSHIDIADHADLVIIAPATANMLAKMACGIADDMLSTTLLAVTVPVFVAPAMNVHMYDHPAVQHNIELLRHRGVRFIEPGVGQLACGYVGKGRMAEPEEIMEVLTAYVGQSSTLAGRKVLVTAGATVERIDPVRYITNDSSGKMGFAIAEAARDMGAGVTLIAGNAAVPPPPGVRVIPVSSAQTMFEAVLDHLPAHDIIIKAAAVADYRPAEQASRKIKKQQSDTLTLQLVKNPDILQAVGERKQDSQVVIGFAAETDHLEQHAQDKLRRKRCDLIVANDVTQEGAGFGIDTNIAQIYDESGLVEALPLMSKREAAERIMGHAAARLEEKGRS